jgi:hypothetical protein
MKMQSKIGSIASQTAITVVVWGWEHVILLCGLTLPLWKQQADIKVQWLLTTWSLTTWWTYV